MDSFIFKGKSSKDFKIIINSLPTISKPPLRVEEIEIDGVDGARYEELGYGCYEKKIKITITENNIDSLINWLKGEGHLILSNEPDKYYNAKIIEQIDFERLMKYEPTEIKFRVQPFKYQYQEEKVIARTGSVEGTKIKINDAKATQMQVDGMSTQNGTPTPDAPVEIESVGYEDLFDKDNIIPNKHLSIDGKENTSSVSSISNFRKVKGEAKYTIIYGNITNYYKVVCFYDRSKNFLNYFTVTDSEHLTTIQTPSNCEYLRFHYQTANVDVVQLVKGTQKRSYIPYGKYGIEVKKIGKNSFNENLYTTSSENGYSLKELEIGKKYTISINNNPNDINYGFLIKTSTGSAMKPDMMETYTNKSATFTYTQAMYDNDYKLYIIDTINYSPISIETLKSLKIQLQEGLVITGYQPYQEKTLALVLNAPLRSLPNGVKDIAYIKNNKLYVDRKIGSVVLNGSETISLYTFSDMNGVLIGDILTENLVRAIGMSNYSSKVGAYYSSNSMWCGVNTKHIYWIGILDELGLSTADELKTWLSTHNTQVDYELATPVTEELGDITILELVDGENNISNSEDANMVVDYVDNKLIINNLGNYVSKPIFEIEGAGTIRFILNDNSVFSYNFDDDGKVVIDSEKEDAYLGLTLKNRNMNGDFPMFNLGENKFTWDGLIKNISVSKKSRWL